MVSLVRPCVSLSFSLVTFPFSFRYRIWFWLRWIDLGRGVSTPFATLFAKFDRRRYRSIPRGNLVCYEVGESIRRIIVLCQYRTSSRHSADTHPCAVVSYCLLHHHYEALDTGTPRWTVRQHSATGEKKKQKRASNVHCYRNSVCILLVTILYQRFKCHCLRKCPRGQKLR